MLDDGPQATLFERNLRMAFDMVLEEGEEYKKKTNVKEESNLKKTNTKKEKQ